MEDEVSPRRHWPSQAMPDFLEGAARVIPRVLAGVPSLEGDHGRGTPAVPQPRADPGHPREPDADSTVLLGFLRYGHH
jgi:hypothetical protein